MGSLEEGAMTYHTSIWEAVNYSARPLESGSVDSPRGRQPSFQEIVSQGETAYLFGGVFNTNTSAVLQLLGYPATLHDKKKGGPEIRNTNKDEFRK